MTTINISLPEAMKAFVEKQVTAEGFSTTSEYLRALIREEQKRKAQQHLETKLLEGLGSGPGIEADERYWGQKRTRLAERTRDRES